MINRRICKLRYYGILLFSAVHSFLSYSQETKSYEGWSQDEIAYDRTVYGLASYIDSMKGKDLLTDTIKNRYFYLDDIMNNPIAEQKARGLASFDWMFSFIPKMIDSVGLENLDVKPLRFYKGTEIYRPFERALAKLAPYVMVYYDQKNPDNPIGTLLFDPKTHKLQSWILIDQGGSGWYYLLL